MSESPSGSCEKWQ